MTYLKTRHFQWTELVIDSDLESYSKYICLYLATFMNSKQNCAFPGLSRIQKETGLTRPTILKYLDKIESAGFLYIERGDRVTSNKYHSKLPDEVVNVVNHPLVKEVYKGSKTGDDKVVNELYPNKQVNNQVNNQVSKHMCFTAPTPDEVKAYAIEKGIKLDHEDFCDFYESKGWMVGKNKMKNWKSAASRWARNNSNIGQKNGNSKNGKFSVGAYVAKQLRDIEEEENSTNIRDIN